MTNAKIIAQTFKNLGIETVYLYPGGTIGPLLDELIKHDIEYFCGKTEQGAGYMALGAAKLTNKPQVVMVTSGPGVTNLTTVVADAYFDSVPLIVITGQVNVASVNQKQWLRQTGFQELNASVLYQPITKKSTLATHELDMKQLVLESYHFAIKDRFGPVHIDLPMDVQKAEPATVSDFKMEPPADVNPALMIPWNKIIPLINNAKRPLIAIGNGVILGSAVTELRELLRTLSIPTVCSLPAVGVLAKNNPNNWGFVGHTGEYYANLALYHADLVIALGSRLDLRQRGSEVSSFVTGKTIVRVDIDDGELNLGEIDADIKVRCDVKSFLTECNSQSFTPNWDAINDWKTKLGGWKKKYSSNLFYKSDALTEKRVIEEVSTASNGKKVIVTSGVGCHQQFTARYFDFDLPNRRWFTSAGHGTMGFDLPTGIGAIVNAPKDYLGIVIVGDGSIQMNIQELAVVAEQQLPIKIIVLDDHSLHLVAQFQNLTWGSAPSTGSTTSPDFKAIATAYGIEGYRVDSIDGLKTIMPKIFSNTTPMLLHCVMEEKEDVLPMLLGGQKLSEMHPFKGEVTLEE